VLAAVAFVGVSSSAPSTPVPSTSHDARFALAANAAASQYCPNSGSSCGGKGGGKGHGHGHGHGHGGGKGGGTGTTTTPTGTGTTGNGNATGAAVTGSANGRRASTATAANANVGPCGPRAYSQQTLQAFSFDNNNSGDVNLYGDTTRGAGTGVTGSSVLLGSKQAAGSIPVPTGSKQILGNGAPSKALGDSALAGSGFLWNVGVPQASRYVGLCSFWPVDPWGRWGFQLYCNQAVPCQDNAVAQSQVGDRRVWRNVTASHNFTILPHRSVLVDLTFNSLGDQLLVQRNGSLAGRILAKTVKNPAEPYVLHGQRNFNVYYARCIVWGQKKPVSQSIEARYPNSAIARAYRMKNLSKLAPNVSLTGTCVG
jgi:hypothetical protein